MPCVCVNITYPLWGRSDQCLLIYSTFDILVHLQLEVLFNLRSSSFQPFLFWFGPLSLSLKFEKDPASGYWDIQLLIFWGCLLLEVVYWRSFSFQAFFILVWSSELHFENWRRSDQWLLRYSTFNILRSSSNGGRLCFKHFYFGLVP